MKINDSTLSISETILDFITKLVVKDEIAANNAETQSSALAASEYISAYLKTDNNTEVQRAYIIANYIELNSYYANLKNTYGIEPYTSRTAKDLDIIYQPKNMITDNKYLAQFKSIYKKCLTAFYMTSYSKAFEGKDNYRELCRFVISLNAYLNLMHKWLETPFDIDLMDENQIDRFMKSFGIPYFSTIPIDYKRILAKNINKIIRQKGTDQVIIDILDMFDFQNIDIYKFYLAKSSTISEIGSPESNYLINEDRSVQFYSHNIRIPSLNVAIKNNLYRKNTYESIIYDDETWQATLDEIQRANFDYVQTKYFSIESGFEISKESMSTIFLLNYIKKIRESFSIKEDLSLNINKISNDSITLEDLIITLQILTLEYNNIADIINYELAGIAGVYQFRARDEDSVNDELFGFLSNPTEREAITLTNMYNVSEFDQAETFRSFDHNFTVYEKILDEMKKETNIHRFKKLQNLYNYKFIQDLSYTFFQGFDTYTNYIRSRNTDLYNYISTLVTNKENSGSNSEIEKEIVYITDSIKEYIDGRHFFVGSTSVSILANYLRQIIETFKSFTVSLKNIDIFMIIKEDSRQKILDNLDNISGSFNLYDNAPELYSRVQYLVNLEFINRFRSSDNFNTTNIIESKDLELTYTNSLDRFIYNGITINYSSPKLDAYDSINFSVNRNLEDQYSSYNDYSIITQYELILKDNTPIKQDELSLSINYKAPNTELELAEKINIESILQYSENKRVFDNFSIIVENP